MARSTVGSASAIEQIPSDCERSIRTLTGSGLPESDGPSRNGSFRLGPPLPAVHRRRSVKPRTCARLSNCAQTQLSWNADGDPHLIPKHVLLVDDNTGDVRLTREAFRNADAFIHNIFKRVRQTDKEYDAQVTTHIPTQYPVVCLHALGDTLSRGLARSRAI